MRIDRTGSNYWQGSHIERSKQAEKAFLDAWLNNEVLVDDIQKVEKIPGDHPERFDIFITMRNGEKICTRSKSHTPRNGLINELFTLGIVIVGIFPVDTPEMIQKNTMESIEKFMVFRTTGKLLPSRKRKNKNYF